MKQVIKQVMKQVIKQEIKTELNQLTITELYQTFFFHTHVSL